jgi:hypothetical protein
VSYLRFTPEEFRAIQQVCHSVNLSDDFFIFFKYFLFESLAGASPGLALRLAHLPARKRRILYQYLREQRASPVKNNEPLTKKDETGCDLTFEELQAVRRASGPFFLHDGSLASFQDYLVYNLGETQPGLATKLARLHPRQIVRLYQQANKRSRWEA